MSGSHGWSHVDDQRKQEIIQAIRTGGATRGPVHAELDLTDRCNVACYFCNQMDVRTRESMPLSRLEELIDELAEGGLKSVRLSGGGDPLMYKHFAEVQEALAERSVVIDNLTTNGALMRPEIADRLVAGQAREVIFSLNAVDGRDYQRMMKVGGKVFDQVVGNIRHLVERRGEAELPKVVVQFLLDPENFRELPRMYELGRSLGVDRIALNVVLEIPRDRLENQPLLRSSDFPRVRPYLEKVLRQDMDAGLLQLSFPWSQWNEQVRRFYPEAVKDPFPAAASFEEKNGHCFFAWYTAAIRGTGETYPCCMLMNPDYEPLGNALEGRFSDLWNGPTFTRMRQEMRDVFLSNGRVFHRRFKTIRGQCIDAHRCGLKNMYFRGDETFYRQLGEAMEEARGREVRWFGNPRAMARSAEILAFRVYHGVRTRLKMLRKRLKKLSAKVLPQSLKHQRLHVGCGNKHLDGWINIDHQKLPEVDVVADVTQGLKFSEAEAIYAEHFLEHLPVDVAVKFLKECHRVLASDGALRLSTPNLDWVWLTHYRLEAEAPEKATMAVNINRAFHGWEHRFLWNREMLEKVLLACGFKDIRWQSYGQSERLIFRNLERHETYPDNPELPHVLVVEAAKGPPQPELLANLQQEIRDQFLNHMKA